VSWEKSLLTPDCPVCKWPPVMLLGPEFAMCGNLDCKAVSWNPSKTLDTNLLNVHFVELEESPE